MKRLRQRGSFVTSQTLDLHLLARESVLHAFALGMHAGSNRDDPRSAIREGAETVASMLRDLDAEAAAGKRRGRK